MRVYYNDHDPYCVQWLRNLIEKGLLPDGDVDDRDIRNVRPEDLRGYGQVHFFAGLGGWPYALHLAEWPSDREVWTGSCPCQPLSVAGQRQGHADERHLWPAFHDLISELKPAVIFGEQVAGKDGREWLSGIRFDLEGSGYACGAADLCAAGVGAPHIRSRLYWVAHAMQSGRAEGWSSTGNGQTAWGGSPSIVANADGQPAGRDGGTVLGAQASDQRQVWRLSDGPGDGRAACDVADANGGNASAEGLQRGGQQRQLAQDSGTRFWDECEWLQCSDGKARAIEPGTFPLAHGIPGRMGRLRAYGNAIVPQVAEQFIRVARDTIGL